MTFAKRLLIKLLVIVMFVAAGMGGFARSASACSNPDPVVVIIIIFKNGPGQYWVVIRNMYKTFAASQGQICGCAFNLASAPSIASIDDVEMVEAQTGNGYLDNFIDIGNDGVLTNDVPKGQPIGGFNFQPDSNVFGGQSGTGFTSSVNAGAGILANQALDLIIHITAASGATDVQIKQDIQNILVRTAHVNANGDPIGHDETASTSPATAIELASFTVKANTDNTVTVRWETGTETDNAGFNLYRSTSPHGPWTTINDVLIPAEGDPISGTSYTFADIPPKNGTFYYKLEDVDTFGVRTQHGPISVQAGPKVASNDDSVNATTFIFLPFLAR
ncbi:fibronectin type III domain-containing protein [Chloroflexi bacterium TSY]|nr:fibronectin type III domain-containing protein [Chloroflexi bacterium TSY]